MYTKWVVIFDEDINIRNYSDVIWAMSVYVDPIRDFMTVADTPIDYLDFASPVSGLGSKIGIDATAKIHPETNRIFGKKIEMDQDVVKKVDKDWAKYGLGEFIESVWKK
jgi:4-hydroxy-3-polyprenylbenzoate decarboxylase